MSLSFVFVLFAGHYFLAEIITIGIIVGTVLIISGIFVASKFGWVAHGVITTDLCVRDSYRRFIGCITK